MYFDVRYDIKNIDKYLLSNYMFVNDDLNYIKSG